MLNVLSSLFRSGEDISDLMIGEEKRFADERFDSDYDEKLNPAQSLIAEEAGDSVSTSKWDRLFNNAYTSIEVVNRGTDMLVDSCSRLDFDVKEKLPFPAIHDESVRPRAKTLHTLLNFRPNPYEDINSFRRNMYMDLIIEGNAFLYFDGAYLYVLPASRVEILTDKKTFIKGYTYNGSNQIYLPSEIIHIKENSTDTLYRGDSRLKSARASINTLSSMLDYQDNFFKNGAVPGLVLKTKDILSQKIKDRMVSMWIQKYNPRTGGRRPVVLDGGLELDSVNSGSFKELDFSTSIKDHEDRILKALGVPPVILNSGNNANITPNLRLFYLASIVPLANKVVSAIERFFAFDIDLDTSKVEALRPELRDEAAYYGGLVNNGILTGNEARKALRYEELDDEQMNTIRIPANIAGSSTGVAGQEGGAPTQTSEDN